MNNQEKFIQQFKQKFRKNFMKTLTSSQYKIPPDSKEMALLKWIEVSTIFDSTLRELDSKSKSKD